MNLGLRAAAYLFERAVKFRLRLYEAGLLSRKSLPAPVVSVGNLTVGGTGKTPIVEYICRQLRAEGYAPAVLSRGYRGKAEKSNLVVRTGGDRPTPWTQVGDEPFLLASRLGEVPVIVGRDRYLSAQLLPEGTTKRVFVLDDAFQHLRLRRDVDLVVLDSTDLLGGGQLIPLGRLREPLEALRRADAILLSRNNLGRAAGPLMELLERLRLELPVFPFIQTLGGGRDLRSGSPVAIGELTGSRVTLFCGIGNPTQFRREVELVGLQVSSFHILRDHHRYTQKDLDRIRSDARRTGADLLLTTEKDAVRLSGLEFPEGTVLAIPLEASPEDSKGFSEWLLRKLGDSAIPEV